MITTAPDPTVHIVDDDVDVRRSLERLLLSAGLTPVLYATPSAVIERASELSEGCLLLDFRLPGMDGLELQARLTHLGVRLPMIVMTGQSDVPTRRACDEGRRGRLHREAVRR